MSQELNLPSFWTHIKAKLPGEPVQAEDPIAGIRANMNWQNAWMKAIAMAWSSEECRVALLADAAGFFKEHCDWEVPSGMILTVTDKPELGPDGPHRWDPEAGGWYLGPTRVAMYLPPRPQLEQQAVALSNYLATGRTYPFTTC